MATVLQRVPVERITAEAQKVEFKRTLLTLFAGLFFVIGWVIGKVFTVLWAAVVWSWAAGKVGFQDARASRDKGG